MPMSIKAVLVFLVVVIVHKPFQSRVSFCFLHCHIVTHFIQQLEHFSSQIESKSLLIYFSLSLGEIGFQTYVYF